MTSTEIFTIRVKPEYVREYTPVTKAFIDIKAPTTQREVKLIIEDKMREINKQYDDALSAIDVITRKHGL